MEFYFSSVLEQHPEGTLIIGITNAGTIRLGDVFTHIARKCVDGRYPPREPVELRVTRITAYRHELDMLPKGMGGGLMVSTALTSALAEGDILSGPDSEVPT